MFTTDRGTPYNLAAVPVVKVGTHSELARRWHDVIDLDAGAIASGEATIEEIGWSLFRLLLQIASGTLETCAKRLNLANSLVVFNPAPVT